MGIHYFNGGITVHGSQGIYFDTAVRLPGHREEQFVDCTHDCLGRLQKTQTGGALLAAIENSGHNVAIFAFDESQPVPHSGKIVTHTRPRGIVNVLDSMIEPFRGNSKNLPLGPKENPEVYKDWKEQLNASGRRVKSVQARDTFSRVLANIDRSYTAGAYYAIKEKTGIGVTRTMDIENGYGKLTDDEYYAIAFEFYDCMLTGPGTNSSIRFTRSTNKRDPEWKTSLPNETLTVILGHELIHAWRKATGRCVVQQGWEEEAMTVGIWKFADLAFTENKLRAELGFAPRTSYKGAENFSSRMAQDGKGMTE